MAPLNAPCRCLRFFELPSGPKSFIGYMLICCRTSSRSKVVTQPAGELVSAESRNTGLGIARLARIRGQGFSRAGQAAAVAGVRAGRVAHPPESWKVIHKKINKKERRLGLCSAIASYIS